jgi:hypothetical protein
MISVRFLEKNTGSSQEFTRKNPYDFRLKYCFHIPAICGVFLQDPLAGMFDLCLINVNK